MLFFRKTINKYEFKQLIDQSQKPEKTDLINQSINTINLSLFKILLPISIC